MNALHVLAVVELSLALFAQLCTVATGKRDAFEANTKTKRLGSVVVLAMTSLSLFWVARS